VTSQTFTITFAKDNGGRSFELEASGNGCQMTYREVDYHFAARSASSSSASSRSGSKPSRAPACVASGGFTNNAGNCCSRRWAHPSQVKATDAHDECK
jgi:hypothetical protein